MESHDAEHSPEVEASRRAEDKTGRYYAVHFPLGEGKTDYEKYLRTVELLSLQTPAEKAVSPDELLFQVTHQTSELWMKLMLSELDRAIAGMNADNPLMACHSFRLIDDCQMLLIMQVDLIARHLRVAEYAKIRTILGQGSGMESPGFNRLLEKSPEIWEAFSALLKRQSLTLRTIYTEYEKHAAWHLLAEALVDYDDRFQKWRGHHYALVARTIGLDSHSLKGLSTRVLQKGVKTRFFPELLTIRSELTNESSVAYGGKPLP